MAIKVDETQRSNIIYRTGRFLLVMYAMGLFVTLGLQRASWPAFVGIVFFTWIFLNYTDNIVDKRVYDSYQKKYTTIFTFIFGILLLGGVNYLCRRSEMTVSVVEVLISIPGMILLVYRSCLLISKLGELGQKVRIDARAKSKWGFILPFVFVWGACFLVFLNMYPGTLSCDTPGQLSQAVELSGFNNLNPLINTLAITLCVQIGMSIGTVNTGIAIYTFIQFTMYAVVSAYTVYVFYKKGFHTVLLILITGYFAWPINLVYATGMWKDTFFAILFLLTLSYCYVHIEDEDLKISSFIILGFLSFVSSLARNSGWSSLGVGAVFLIVYGSREKCERRKNTALKVGLAQFIGVLTACFFIAVIYPLAGASNAFDTITKSVPLQQISRAVIDNELSADEIADIKYFGKSDQVVDEISDYYAPGLVDGVRGLFNGNTIKENSGKFNLLWLELGLHYPVSYVHAFIDHTAGYWWPDAGSWLVDNRIFDNNYGVERTSKFIPGKDLAMGLYRILTYIPKLNLLSNSGFTFWMILLCIYICHMHRNKVGALLNVPIIMIYIGLLPISYGALFRYTYAAVLSMPMLLGYMFIQPSFIAEEKKDRKTDWTEYYQHKKSFFSIYTQRFTLKKILDCINQSIGNNCNSSSIMELGGGNSCFAKKICDQQKISNYDIVDNNELAVEFFNRQELNSECSIGVLQDLTEELDDVRTVYDFVFSIGLIEHFQLRDRKRVIENHFKYCKPGGFVMISFPTPTRKYLFWRRVMELLGAWIFWDETPLVYDEIKDELTQNGRVIKVELNKKLYLTQMIVLIHKQDAYLTDSDNDI